MSYLDNIFLWLGNINLKEDEFNEYFKLDYSVEGDFDDPNYKLCGFCRDIEEKWYDEDFIGYIKYEKEMPILDLLTDVPIAKEDKHKVIEKAAQTGLTLVNAVYWYSGEISEPDKDKSYNGLKYLGEFSLD